MSSNVVGWCLKVTLCLICLSGVLSTSFVFAQGSFSKSCISRQQNFISRYLAGNSQAYEIKKFFKCVDNSIQFFLNHTSTARANSYTQVEITRFMQYMGLRYKKAARIGQAVFGIKQSLMGGQADQLSVREIQVVRRLLFILSAKMQSLHSVVPTLLAISQKKVRRFRPEQLSYAAKQVRTNIRRFGSDLSMLPVQMNLALLQNLPRYIRALGFSSEQLEYWSPSLLLIRQWRKIFSNGPKHIISGTEWKNLLDSFGGLVELWFHYKSFLENRALLSVHVVQHTQYFVSQLFSVFQNAYQVKKDIPLTEIDTLLKKVWFFPWLSTPVAKLSIRSVFCFVLDRLAFGQSCKHQITFKESSGELKVDFGDLDFMVTPEGRMAMTVSKVNRGRLTQAHISVVRHYLNNWIQSEKKLRQKGKLPSLFGSPNQWLRRNIRLTLDQRLLFDDLAISRSKGGDNGRHRLDLLSHLNWQSHFMKLIANSYAVVHPSSQINREVWDTIVREWSILATAFYPGTHWKTFQSEGFSFFSLGDFLTAHANGDYVLQDQELLELFSLSMSAWRTVLLNQKRLSVCEIVNTKWSEEKCVLNIFNRYSEHFFLSFPDMRGSVFGEEWDAYSAVLNQFKNPLDNIFTVFVLAYYQENMLEYLDKDLSGNLDVQELHAMVDVFKDMLMDEFPLVNSEKEIFAVISYLFRYGKLPILSNGEHDISSPIHFADWVIRSEQWKDQITARKDILRALIYLRDFP